MRGQYLNLVLILRRPIFKEKFTDYKTHLFGIKNSPSERISTHCVAASSARRANYYQEITIQKPLGLHTKATPVSNHGPKPIPAYQGFIRLYLLKVVLQLLLYLLQLLYFLQLNLLFV